MEKLTQQEIDEILNPENLSDYDKKCVEKYRAEGMTDEEIAAWFKEMQ